MSRNGLLQVFYTVFPEFLMLVGASLVGAGISDGLHGDGEGAAALAGGIGVVAALFGGAVKPDWTRKAAKLQRKIDKDNKKKRKEAARIAARQAPPQLSAAPQASAQLPAARQADPQESNAPID